MTDANIELMENGPLLVQGPLTYSDAAGDQTRLDRKWVALCRCGGSANKPFCDGTHKGKFQAAKGEFKAE